MKNTYIAATTKENGKYYSWVLKAGKGNNLVSILKRDKVTNALICESKLEAENIVQDWNDSYKANGTYMFDTPLF